MNNDEISPAKTRRARLSLVLLVALFVLPPLLAWLVFQHPELLSGRPSNHGQLVEPPRPVDEVALRRPDGSPLPARLLFGKWTLVHFVDGPCTAVCRASLYQTRQVRTLLLKDVLRVQRLLVTAAAPSAGVVAELAAQHPDLTLATGSQEVLARLARVFEVAAEPGPDPFFLVDPLSNVMMFYRATDDPSGLVKDLKVLLKYSRVG